MKSIVVLACWAALAAGAWAQNSAAAKPDAKAAAAPAEHVKADIARHRAMAAAHESAARCLEAGKSEDACQKELQAACKGLAIGRYCGMRHEH